MAAKRAQAKSAAQLRVVDDAPAKAKKPRKRKKLDGPKRPPGRPGHKRTPETERIVRALVQANPSVRHQIIADALGLERTRVLEHYGDLIPHPGPGRPEHEPTTESRQLVEQHVGLGLNQEDIAFLLGMEVDCLRKHYRQELDAGAARMIYKIGSKIVMRALSPTDPQAQRAAEFLLDRRGGEAWIPRSRLGLDRDTLPPAQEPLVNGRQAVTRQDARRVAFLLAKEAAQQPARDEDVVLEGEIIEPPPSGPVRGG